MQQFGPSSPLAADELSVLEGLAVTLERSPLVQAGEQFFLSPDFCSAAFSEMLERKAGMEVEANPALASIWYKLALRSWLSTESHLTEKAASSAYVLGRLLHYSGIFETSRMLLEEVLEAFSKWEGSGSEKAITAALHLSIVLLDMDLAQVATQLLTETYKRSQRSFGAEHPLTLACRTNIADAMRTQGLLDGAYRLERSLLKTRRRLLGEVHPDTLTLKNNFAFTCRELGRLAEAKLLQEEVLKERRAQKGSNNRETTTAISNLAATIYSMGEWQRALDLEREALARREKEDGSDHPDTLTAKNNLSGTLRDLGEIDEARHLLTEVVTKSRAQGRLDHHETLIAEHNLAAVLIKYGELDRAESYAEHAYNTSKSKNGESHPITLDALDALSAVHFHKGNVAEALKLHTFVAQLRSAQVGENHPATLLAKNDLARILNRLGRFEEGATLSRDVLRRTSKLLGPAHSDTLTARLNLGEALAGLHDETKARNEGRHIIEQLRERASAFSEDFELAYRTFSLLVRVASPKQLRKPFREVSHLLHTSLETLRIDSLRRLRPMYLQYQQLWLSFCLEHAINEFSLPLIAMQSFDNAELLLAHLQTSPRQDKNEFPVSEVARARDRLIRSRIHVEQIDKRRSHTSTDPWHRNKSELAEERKKFLQNERRAIEAYQKAKERYAARNPRLVDVLAPPSPRVDELAALLAPDELLIVLYKASSDSCGVIIVGPKGFERVVQLEMASLIPLSSARQGRSLHRFENSSRTLLCEDQAGAEERDALQAPAGQMAEPHLPQDYSPLWAMVRATARDLKKAAVVTTSGLAGFLLEVGNPDIVSEYYTSLLGFHHVRKLRASSTTGLPQRVEVIGEPAWMSMNPIAFVEAESRLVCALIFSAESVRPKTLLNSNARRRNLHKRSLSIACHGRLVGASEGQYPTLALGAKGGSYLSPSDVYQIAPEIEGMFCSACVGGFAGETSFGTSLGLISSLQSFGVGSLVASVAPVPDYYMPLLAGLYWLELQAGQSSAAALHVAKRNFATGRWPELLTSHVRKVYKAQIARVLLRGNRYLTTDKEDLRKVGKRLALSSDGWLWPETIVFETNQLRVRQEKSCAELFHFFSETKGRRGWLSNVLADYLVAKKSELPATAVATICDSMMSYG